MRKFTTIAASVLLAMSLVFQVNCLAQGFFSKSGVGKVTVNSQPVEVIREGKSLSVGSFGFTLKKGDVVQTRDGGKATITLQTGNKIFLASNTKIEMSDQVIGKSTSAVSRLIHLFYGKIRAHIQKMRKRRVKIKTATAVIGVKGTDFVTEFKEETTVVGTVDGLVNMSSLKTKQSVDIPPGKMSSVSPSGEVMPLSEIAGELLKGVEFAGKKMDSKDIAGEKIKM